MKKALKKILMLGTAAALMLGCLSACGNSEMTLRIEAENADLSACQAQPDPYEEEKFLLTPEGDEYAKSIFGPEASGEGLMNYGGITRQQVESWVGDLILDSSDASEGKYLRQWGEVGGNTVTFTFESNADTTATMVFRMASDEYNWNSLETSDKTDLDQAIGITVNGTALNLGGITITGSFDDVTETAFQDVTFENVNIVKGTNTIQMVVFSFEEQVSKDEFIDGQIVSKTITVERTNGAPNLDYIDITATAKLS